MTIHADSTKENMETLGYKKYSVCQQEIQELQKALAEYQGNDGKPHTLFLSVGYDTEYQNVVLANHNLHAKEKGLISIKAQIEAKEAEIEKAEKLVHDRTKEVGDVISPVTSIAEDRAAYITTGQRVIRTQVLNADTSAWTLQDWQCLYAILGSVPEVSALKAEDVPAPTTEGAPAPATEDVPAPVTEEAPAILVTITQEIAALESYGAKLPNREADFKGKITALATMLKAEVAHAKEQYKVAEGDEAKHAVLDTFKTRAVIAMHTQDFSPGRFAVVKHILKTIAQFFISAVVLAATAGTVAIAYAASPTVREALRKNSLFPHPTQLPGKPAEMVRGMEEALTAAPVPVPAK